MIKIAAAQLTPAESVCSRQDQMRQMLKVAQKQQVDFICFFEGFLTRYFSDEKKAWKECLDVEEDVFAKWLKITCE